MQNKKKMPDISKMRKLGKRTIEVLEYGGQRTKKIKRIVYSKPTLTKGHPTYWFELVNGIWKNTTKKGIKTGIVVTKNEFAKLQKTATKTNRKIKSTFNTDTTKKIVKVGIGLTLTSMAISMLRR